MYNVPFAISLAALGVGLFLSLRRSQASWLSVVATSVLAAVVVLVSDLFVVVLLSCAQGICL